MKTILLTLLGVLPLAAFGEGITNGQYEISFRISDMEFQQAVRITNCWWTPNSSCMYYDVVLEKNGSLKRFTGDRQVVRGILYNGKFKFVIPYANVVNVDPYIFEADNTQKDGAFEGSGDVPFQGPNAGHNKFRFWMRKTAPDKAGSTLQRKADEIHAKLAAFSKTDNYQLLTDAAKTADSLYPQPWPREMTGQAEQMLRLRLEVIKVIDSAIDRAFDPSAPQNRAFINVAPPVMPTNPPGVTASGMDPAGIADPVARKAYEEAIEKNRKKLAKINREHSLKMALDRCVLETSVFLVNLGKDSPAHARAIQIVEQTVNDTNVVRKLERQ